MNARKQPSCDCMKLTDTTSGLLGHKDEREEWDDSVSSPPHFTRLSTFGSGLREGMGEGEEEEGEEEEEELEVESSIHG